MYIAAVTHYGGNTQCKLGLDPRGFVKHRCLYTESSLGWQSNVQYGGLHLEMHGKYTMRNRVIFSLLTRGLSPAFPGPLTEPGPSSSLVLNTAIASQLSPAASLSPNLVHFPHTHQSLVLKNRSMMSLSCLQISVHFHFP